ncbi:hypothetical protein GGS21DRAFT_502850 [Xylaria nigripes]|nr:hypothetical protein GGS21DRAFT_502850 [Xylaria nigripes]
MRRSSLFAILAVGLSAQPVPQLSNSILDILPGGVLDNVSGLLGHSLDHPHHKNSTVPQCTLDSHLCIATCAPDCLGSTRACLKCMTKCNQETGCDDEDEGDSKDGKDGKEGP